MDCSLPRLLCPRDSPGKNTGMGCQFLLHGICPNAGVEPRSPALQADSLPSGPLGPTCFPPECVLRAILLLLSQGLPKESPIPTSKPTENVRSYETPAMRGLCTCEDAGSAPTPRKCTAEPEGLTLGTCLSTLKF